nr:hypothetical protein [Tanacetum cinerariifolium]
EGGHVLTVKVINLDSTKDLPPPHNVNPLSGSTTSSSSLNHLLEEFADELTLITFPPRNDDLPFDDKVFNLGILIQKNLSEVNTRIAPDKNVKKIAISHASLILEGFDPRLYELPFLEEVPSFETLLSFSFKNEEKVFKPRILTSKEIHFSLLPEIYHQGHKVFKIIKILESPMEIFPCFCEEDIRILDVPCIHFYPL